MPWELSVLLMVMEQALDMAVTIYAVLAATPSVEARSGAVFAVH
jgi:hypothetical protein